MSVRHWPDVKIRATVRPAGFMDHLIEFELVTYHKPINKFVGTQFAVTSREWRKFNDAAIAKFKHAYCQMALRLYGALP